MTITAKFDGRCKACGCDMPKGTIISWSRETGARHVSSQACETAKAARDARRQAMYTATPTIAAPVFTLDGASIVALLTMASAHIKFPKVRFAGPNGRELLLSLASKTSKNPGAVYVKVGGDYAGLIAADGSLRGRLTNDGALLALLTAIAAEPARLAREYGALTGHCSFCNLQLTDAGSVEVGYGPVCAKHYGLPHTPKGTPGVTAIPTSVDIVAA